MNPLGSLRPDYLGETWVSRTIYLSDDDGGMPKDRPDVAVIVHETDAAELAQTSGIAALWLPGFIDSFFHVEHAKAWRDRGVPLFGLDFRRSGRALRDPRFRDDIRDIFVREEEIHASLSYIRELGAQKIVLIGHSTGGLQAALFAHNHPGAVDAIILNSPWLEHNGPDFEKNQLTDIMMTVGAVTPHLPISRLRPAYAQSLHSDFGGEFYFNPAHKLVTSGPVFAGFFRAARIGHRFVANGLEISEPLLVAHSSASGDQKHPTEEELARTDVVLNVADIKRLGPTLGSNVTMVEIPGGRHDLSLSELPARNRYARETINWALSKLGA